MNKDILIGKTQTHINSEYGLHKEVVPHYQTLHASLKELGHDLKVVSGFRDFKRQLHIWNQKAQGKRDILDNNSNKMDYNLLTNKELVYAILRWSALPGASRHHWGTDFDIIDQATLPKGYQVKLTPEETQDTGHFYKIHNSLNELIKNDPHFLFFRPYDEDKGGVSPEKWHLSYRPLALEFYKEYSLDFFVSFLEAQDPHEFLLLDIIKDDSKKIYERFVSNISF